MITKRPMVVLLMPDSFSQIVSVESVNKKGRPLENPKRKIDRMRLSIKATTLFFQECINVSQTLKKLNICDYSINIKNG